MGAFGFLVQREVIVAVAVLGALLATVGSLRGGRGRLRQGLPGVMVKAGYALTGISIVLMIVAGFMSGR